ncbi:tRNA pseudouridine(13) synthase TruD [Thermoproteota archaeon]
MDTLLILKVLVVKFIVEELIDSTISTSITEKPSTTNKFPIFKLVKEGVDTINAVQKIQNNLGWNVHYLGLKDKHAQTIQYISPKRLKNEISNNIQITKQISLDFYGFHSSLLTRKDLVGNSFTIKIRDIQCNPEHLKKKITELKHSIKNMNIPNFYGYQRFGSKRPVNHLIGRAIVKRQFEKAVTIILSQLDEDKKIITTDDIKDPIKQLFILKKFNGNQDIEKRVLKSLIKQPNNWINAIRSVPITVRRLYIHAYQSFIFNRVMSNATNMDINLFKVENGDIFGVLNQENGTISEIRRLSDKVVISNEKKTIPLVQLVGYTFKLGNGRFDQLIQEVLEEEDISPKLFYNKEISELSMAGGFRIPPLLVNDLEISVDTKDPFSTLIQFSLLKGSYATILLRELIKPFDPVAAGF